MNASSENDSRRTTPTGETEEKKDETNAKKKTTNAKKEKPKSARGAPPRRRDKEDVFGDDGFNARRGGGG